MEVFFNTGIKDPPYLPHPSDGGCDAVIFALISRKPKEFDTASQTLSSNIGPRGRDLSRSTRRYKLVALGGTFDVLHAGHRHLLSEAFKLGDMVLIGVTSDHLVATLDKKHEVRPFSSRVRDLRRFLNTRRWSSRARVTMLREPYGPAAKRKRLDALIVSKGTLASGRRLNRLRRKNDLQRLDLHVVDLLRADDGRPVSTSRVRSGEIDLQGRVLKARH